MSVDTTSEMTFLSAELPRRPPPRSYLYTSGSVVHVASPSTPSSLTYVHRCIGSHNETRQTLTTSPKLTYLSVYDNRDCVHGYYCVVRRHEFISLRSQRISSGTSPEYVLVDQPCFFNFFNSILSLPPFSTILRFFPPFPFFSP